MFDTPVDAWYLWVGLAVASLAVLGTALLVAAGTPTGAARVADAIDEVAASPYLATETVALDGEALRLGPSRLALRTRAGIAHATLAYAPVTPVIGGRLGTVLRGRAVAAVFDSSAAFRRALVRARDRARDRGGFRPAPTRLTVRRVSWGEVDATLVG